jgi:predicted nucleic acid-binding protein
MKVVADADAIIAFSDETHPFHTRIRKLVLKLAKLNGRVIFPITSLAEATRYFQTQDKPEIAWVIVKNIEMGRYPPVPVDKEIFREAIRLFNPYNDPGDTLFDAIVAVIVKKYEADAVFGFDHWYREIGLQLAENLFSSKR